MKLDDWLRNTFSRLHPAQIIFLSYLFAIILGTFLLMLPISTNTGSIALIDAVFTATSAVCVTGLVVVDTGSYFTSFGQMVILGLIQLGGLGIMTFSVAFFRLIGRQISFRQRRALQDVFTHTSRENIYDLLKSIFLFTIATELLGMGLLYLHWIHHYPWHQAMYLAVFHAVSAFCNAGFALFETSMMDYRDIPLLNVTVMLLVVLGGLGFPVVYDLYTTYVKRSHKRQKLLAQTKIVLVTSIILIIVGALLFSILEAKNTLHELLPSEVIWASLFQSVTARTAGFNTVDIASLTEPTLVMMMILMFIGASPGSCGGGIKTTTFALLAAFAWSRFKHEYRVNLFQKSIPVDILTKSIALVLIAIVLTAALFFLLLLSSPYGLESGIYQNQRFLPFLFETVSAVGTVGLSMGVTPQLTILGKIWIIVMMLVGRVGVLTFAYVVVGPTATQGIEYAEENIMVG